MKTKSTLSAIMNVICAVALVVMALISIVIYHASAFSIFVFCLFLLLYVQIPGLFLVDILKTKIGHFSEKLLISFYVGWALIIIEYLLSNYTGLPVFLMFSGPVLSLLYIISIISDKTNKPWPVISGIKKIPPSFSLAVTVLALYVLLNTQYLYLSPEYSKCIFASIDKTYQAGLVSSLSHGYPIRCPWVDGITEYYHVFTQLLLSVPVKLFKLTPDFMVMSCSPYMTIYLIPLSFYSLFKHFCRRQDRVGLYTLSVFLSYMFIARSITSSYLSRILFVNDNHGGFAVSGAIASIILIDIALTADNSLNREKISHLILISLLFMLLSGIKAPVALVMLAGLWGAFLLSLVLKAAQLKEEIPILLTTSVSFVAVFSFLLLPDDTSGVVGESNIRFGKMTSICFWKSGLIEEMKQIGLPSTVRLLIILAVFAVFFFTIYSLPLLVGYLRELMLVLRKKKPFSFARVAVYGSFLVGLILMMFTGYSGNSQIYFGTVTAAFTPLIAFWFFEDASESEALSMKLFFNASRVWFFVAIILTALSLSIGIRNLIPNAVIHSNPESQYNPYLSLSVPEYEATQWIKANTPSDSLIATQMYSSVARDEYDYKNRWYNCHFLYATYSDRWFYLEGSGFSMEDYEAETRKKMVENTDALFDVNNSSRGDLARNLGINYVMATKKLYPYTDLHSDDYSLVFSNDDVDIYEVVGKLNQ